ncbi:2-oxo acid dehydrogenase subunit E2 [Acuticoccus sp. M5D2P5]|uniref:2-oxo acid dehydrogenase subunit E2 n=1 Tax=Acuticoccus kalidii TaxID=2910977 RepID=UPI001F3DE4E9|nr:2-oxo acid dehydrogenase subunit E2 [Acuticoccus kalidii]MCF3932929.1 2-oxo acid dehydrogenase subunit E2 [Acuticoccus kalidii]
MMDVAASPSVRRYARELGIDIARLGEELQSDTVTRRDVERKAAGGGVPATDAASLYWEVDHAQYGPVSDEPVPRREQVAAANLAAAQALIPAVTHHDRAEIAGIEAARTRLKPLAEAAGVRLTALAFHVKALARTLALYPRFNASLSPDGTRLVIKHYCHVGIAVDTPHGLMVPVVRNADRKGLLSIAAEIGALAARARDRKLRSQEMGGASMSITNLGGIGGTGFTPIVNPPEVAILGLCRSETVPVWTGEAFEPRLMVPLALSYDHRVINGADAARFLAHYARLLAEPARLLL